MAQIEPIEFLSVNNEIKWGVNLRVYYTYLGSNRVKADITDIDNNVLFETILSAKTLDEVAEKLDLTLKTDTVDNTKELLTEIMEAAKDGLYEQEQRMYSEKEVLDLLNEYNEFLFTFIDKDNVGIGVERDDVKKWFEQFKNK